MYSESKIFNYNEFNYIAISYKLENEDLYNVLILNPMENLENLFATLLFPIY